MRLVLSLLVAGEAPGEVVALDVIKTRHLPKGQLEKRKKGWREHLNLGKTRASMPSIVREIRK